jgi:hypothetical protein
MPNWCSNNFTVYHKDPEMIKKFADALSAQELFTKLVPLPTENNEWDYNSALETWGTKWDATPGDVQIDEEGKSCSGWFETPWGPGILAYEKLSELGFEVDITFHEPGMCFAGRFTSPDEEYYVEYNFGDENWRDKIDDDEVLSLLEYEYENWLEWQEELAEEEDGSDK